MRGPSTSIIIALKKDSVPQRTLSNFAGNGPYNYTCTLDGRGTCSNDYRL